MKASHPKVLKVKPPRGLFPYRRLLCLEDDPMTEEQAEFQLTAILSVDAKG